MSPHSLEDSPHPPAEGATWLPLREPFQLEPNVPGTSADHEMGIYGEVTKFLWFLCESIKEEPDACYIMATEFASVGVPIMMLMEPEWTYKKAQLQTMEIYKCVIPQYLLASQKLDFLCFTEGLYKMAQRFLPNASAEDRAVWLAHVGNRIAKRVGSTCVDDNDRLQHAAAVRSMRLWSARHRNCTDAIFGTGTDVAAMYDCQLAEYIAHDFELFDMDKDFDNWVACSLRDSSFSQRIVGLFGQDQGIWQFPEMEPEPEVQEVVVEETEPGVVEEVEEVAVEPIVQVVISPSEAPTPKPAPRPVFKPKKKRPPCVKPPDLYHSEHDRNHMSLCDCREAERDHDLKWICFFTRQSLKKTARPSLENNHSSFLKKQISARCFDAEPQSNLHSPTTQSNLHSPTVEPWTNASMYSATYPHAGTAGKLATVGSRLGSATKRSHTGDGSHGDGLTENTNIFHVLMAEEVTNKQVKVVLQTAAGLTLSRAGSALDEAVASDMLCDLLNTPGSVAAQRPKMHETSKSTSTSRGGSRPPSREASHLLGSRPPSREASHLLEHSDALSIEGSFKTPVRRSSEELRRRLGHPALNPLLRSARASTADAFVFYAKHPRPHVGSKTQKQMLLPTRVIFDAAYTKKSSINEKKMTRSSNIGVTDNFNFGIWHLPGSTSSGRRSAASQPKPDRDRNTPQSSLLVSPGQALSSALRPKLLRPKTTYGRNEAIELVHGTNGSMEGARSLERMGPWRVPDHEKFADIVADIVHFLPNMS